MELATSRASGTFCLGEEEEGDETGLLGTSARRGEHGGCGNRRRWRRLRSGPRCGARGRAGEGDEHGRELREA